MKGKLNFYNLSPKSQANLKDGMLLAAAAGSAYGIFGLLGTKVFSKSEIENISQMSDSDQAEHIDESCEIIEELGLSYETSMDVVEINEEVNFSAAFAQARADQGPGGFFNFKDRTYTTYLKEEVDGLNSEQQNDIVSAIEDTIDDQTPEPIGIEDDVVVDGPSLIIAKLDDIELGQIQSDDFQTYTIDTDYSTSEEPSSLSSDEFEDSLFDNADIAESSSSGHSSQDQIVVDYDEFNDPLFNDIEVTESSSSEVFEGYAESELPSVSENNESDLLEIEDNTILVAESSDVDNLSQVNVGDEFNDSLFNNDFEQLESSIEESTVYYGDQDVLENNEVLPPDEITDHDADISDIQTYDDLPELD